MCDNEQNIFVGIMSTRFEQNIVEQSNGDWELAQSLNLALDTISAQKQPSIELDEVFAKSKIAWKYAVLRQSLTYRIVDLANSTVEQWNRENILTSIIIARSLIETCAIVNFVSCQMKRHLNDQDIDKLDGLVMQQTFGGRHDYWNFDGSYIATNVLSALDLLDKEIHGNKEKHGIRDFYERMSETVHPNSQGHQQFYATIDKQTASVAFSRTKRGRSDTWDKIGASLMAVEWSIKKLEEIDRMLEQVADLQS